MPVVAPVVVALRPPGDAVTVYLVIPEPPLLPGAVQVTTAAALPAAPDTLVGACGVVAVGVTALLAAEDGDVPADGLTSGEVLVRGPWIAASYAGGHTPERWTDDGYFRTGDVARLDEHGFIQLTDRIADLIKSGGEWIATVEIENAIMGHPAVKEAAVVGVPHPKWSERPLAAVVLKEGASLTADELRDFLAPKFAKFWLPDAVVFVDAIPRTSAGKFKKSDLRERFRDWKW